MNELDIYLRYSEHMGAILKRYRHAAITAKANSDAVSLMAPLKARSEEIAEAIKELNESLEETRRGE